jgi:hypothetical protein
MNELGSYSDQLFVIRELIEDTIAYLNNNGDIKKSIGMLQAASTLLELHSDKFDKKFSAAWDNTVGAMKDESYNEFAKKFYTKLEQTNDSFYKEQE